MEAFDYIVVDAGSAGCVFAARLTEQRDSASANTNAATIMIGGKAADLIRGAGK